MGGASERTFGRGGWTGTGRACGHASASRRGTLARVCTTVFKKRGWLRSKGKRGENPKLGAWTAVCHQRTRPRLPPCIPFRSTGRPGTILVLGRREKAPALRDPPRLLSLPYLHKPSLSAVEGRDGARRKAKHPERSSRSDPLLCTSPRLDDRSCRPLGRYAWAGKIRCPKDCHRPCSERQRRAPSQLTGGLWTNPKGTQLGSPSVGWLVRAR